MSDNLFQNLSLSARRAVFFARREAGRLGADAMGPEHLLLGFLAVDQGEFERRMPAILGGTDATAPRPVIQPVRPFLDCETAANLRQAVVESANLGEPKPDSIDMPLAEEAKSALLAAQDHAGGSTIDLPHILRGLLNDKESFAGNLLETNGVTVEQVDAAIRDRQRG